MITENSSRFFFFNSVFFRAYSTREIRSKYVLMLLEIVSFYIVGHKFNILVIHLFHFAFDF